MLFFLGLLLSTALYGIFALLVATLGFHVSLSSMFQATFQVSNFMDVFYAFMVWAPAAYVSLSLLHYLIIKIRKSERSFLTDMLRMFVTSFSNPWRGLVTLSGASKVIDTLDLDGLYCWVEVIVHFVWSIGLFGFIGYGFYLIAK